MALNYVSLPIEYFPDPTKGRPVFNGSIYVGQPNLDPEIEANRIDVTLRQQDGVEVVIQPASQPLLTGAGGVVIYDGSPVTMLADGNYSLKVLDKQGGQVYYIEDALDGVPISGDQTVLTYENVAEMVADTSLTVGQLARTKGYYDAGDGGGALYLIQVTQPVDGFGDHDLANGNVALLQVSGAIPVKQLGPVGDGTTDDTLAIAAFFARISSGGAVEFGGVYCLMTDRVDTSLSGDITLSATNGGGFIFSTGIVDRALEVVSNGYDVSFFGVNFDGSDSIPMFFRILNTANEDGKVSIVSCEVRNIYRSLASYGTGAADAVHIRGGFEQVTLRDTTVKNVNRDAGTGIFGVAGSTGISIFQDSTGVTRSARKVIVDACDFDTITSNEPAGGNNYDCDGIKVFNGSSVLPESESVILDTSFVISGCTFVDCKGRAIKSQTDKGVCRDNTIIRKGVLPIQIMTDIDMQIGEGIASGNSFIYNEINGQSPFSPDGGTTPTGVAISVYHAAKTSRASGFPVIRDNTIYNNVDPAVGALRVILDASINPPASTFTSHYTIDSLKMLGGACDTAVSFPTDTSTAGHLVIIDIRNVIANTLTAFTSVNTSAAKALRVIASGCCNTSGTDVVFCENLAGAGETQINVTGYANFGIVDDATNIATTSAPVFRTNGVFPKSGFGGLNLDGFMLTNDEEYIARPMGNGPTTGAICFLSMTANFQTQIIFQISPTGFFDYTDGAYPIFAFGAGVDPNEAGRVNIWHDGTTLRIINRFGSMRSFTLGYFG